MRVACVIMYFVIYSGVRVRVVNLRTRVKKEEYI